MPTTPDPQTTREAFRAPDANDWKAVIDAEIDDIRRLNIFKEVPRPNAKNGIAEMGLSPQIRERLTHQAQGAIGSTRIH